MGAYVSAGTRRARNYNASATNRRVPGRPTRQQTESAFLRDAWIDRVTGRR